MAEESKRPASMMDSRKTTSSTGFGGCSKRVSTSRVSSSPSSSSGMMMMMAASSGSVSGERRVATGGETPYYSPPPSIKVPRPKSASVARAHSLAARTSVPSSGGLATPASESSRSQSMVMKRGGASSHRGKSVPPGIMMPRVMSMTVERKGEKFVKLVDSDGKPLPRDERHRVLGPHLKVAYAQLKHPNLAAVRVSKTRDGVLFAEETGRTLADAQLSTEVAAVIALKMARAVLFLESNGLTADLSPSSVLVDVAREPFYFSNATRVRSVKLTGVKEGGPGSDPGWGNLFESMLYESPSMLTAADNPLRAPCLEIAKRGPRSAGQLAKLLEAHGVHEPEASKAEPAELYDTLGSAFFDYSPQIAEELLREFLSRTEDKATGHARLAFALKSRRKFDEAVEHLNAAIEIDDEPRKKATHLQSLAMVLYRQGKFDDARPHLERAVAFFERYEPARLATALNNLAGLLYHQGEDARPLYLRALEIDTKTYGEAHPKVALRLNNLAHVYGDEGDHKTALEHISRCLKIWEKTVPDEAHTRNAQDYQAHLVDLLQLEEEEEEDEEDHHQDAKDEAREQKQPRRPDARTTTTTTKN